MKDSDKVTLTVGQLKKLVKESKKLNEGWFSKNEIEDNDENKRAIAQIISIFATALKKAANHLSKLEDKGDTLLVNDLDDALFAPLSSGIEEIISKYHL